MGAAMRFIALIFALLFSWSVSAQVPMTGAGLGAPASGGGGTPSVTSLGNAASGATAGTTVTMTVANALAAGHLASVLVLDSNTTSPVTSVTDLKGNTYSPGPSIPSAGLYEFHSFIATPLTTSDTIVFHDTAATGTNFLEITGYTFSASAYDAATANTNTSGFGTTFSITSGTPAVANETFVAFSVTNATGFTALPGGWVNNPPTINACCTTNQLPGAIINAGTSPVSSWSGTTTSSQVTNTIILSFKP